MLANFTRTALACAIALSGIATAPPAAADANVVIRKASIKLDGRAMPPTFDVRYYDNISDWDVAGGTVFFDLALHLRSNASSHMVNYGVRGPDSSTWLATDQTVKNFVTNWRSTPPTTSHPSSKLGAATKLARATCRKAMPGGNGTRQIAFTMPVDIKIVVHRFGNFRSRTIAKAIPAIANCQGRPPANRTSGMKPRKFKVTGASIGVTNTQGICPRTIFVKPNLFANMDGKASYTLKRSDGADIKDQMLINTHNGKKWKGSFAHKIVVTKPGILKVSVHHKGTRISGIRKIRVKC